MVIDRASIGALAAGTCLHGCQATRDSVFKGLLRHVRAPRVAAAHGVGEAARLGVAARPGGVKRASKKGRQKKGVKKRASKKGVKKGCQKQASNDAPEHAGEIPPPVVGNERHEAKGALDARGVAHQSPHNEEHLPVAGAEGVAAGDHVCGDCRGWGPVTVADQLPQQAPAHCLGHVEAPVGRECQ